MLRLSGSLSRALNYWTGGERGQTLCARIAIRFGSDCLFCRVVGAVLNDPWHCLDEKVRWLLRK